MIDVVKLKWNEFSEIENEVAIDTASGAYVPMGADHKMLILITNDGSESANATVKAGTGIQATEDVTVSVAANKTAAISVESGKFLIVEGDNAGSVLVTASSSNLKVKAIELP